MTELQKVAKYILMTLQAVYSAAVGIGQNAPVLQLPSDVRMWMYLQTQALNQPESRK